MKRLATYLYFRESGFSRRDAWRVATGEIQARLTSWAELRIEILTEQPFPADHMHQCQAAAKRHRKGDRVTVQAPVHSHRLAIVASHIHTNPTH